MDNKDLFNVSIFVVTEQSEYINVGEYDSRYDGEGCFIMLTNDALNTDYKDDNTIFVSRNWFEYIGGKFVRKEIKEMNYLSQGLYEKAYKQVYLEYHRQGGEFETFKEDFVDKDDLIYPNKSISVERNGQRFKCNTFISQAWYGEIPGLDDISDIDDAIVDLNGYENTKKMIRASGWLFRQCIDDSLGASDVENYFPLESPASYFPAARTAFDTREMFDGQMMQGYLPSLGQLVIIVENIERLQIALKKIGDRHYMKLFEKKRGLLFNGLLSSTPIDEECMWGISDESIYKGYTSTIDKMVGMSYISDINPFMSIFPIFTGVR